MYRQNNHETKQTFVSSFMSSYQKGEWNDYVKTYFSWCADVFECFYNDWYFGYVIISSKSMHSASCIDFAVTPTLKFPSVRMTTGSYTHTVFAISQHLLLNVFTQHFETLTFRDSIDIYFKSTFLIFLTKPNVPTKIVNVPTDKAGLTGYATA